MIWKHLIILPIFGTISAVSNDYYDHHDVEDKTKETPAKYEFAYGVHDEHTKDIKMQKESRVGDAVHGKYELVDSDGFRRIVTYTADDQNGFQANVRREKVDIKVPIPDHQQYYKENKPTEQQHSSYNSVAEILPTNAPKHQNHESRTIQLEKHAAPFYQYFIQKNSDHDSYSVHHASPIPKNVEKDHSFKTYQNVAPGTGAQNYYQNIGHSLSQHQPSVHNPKALTALSLVSTQPRPFIPRIQNGSPHQKINHHSQFDLTEKHIQNTDSTNYADVEETVSTTSSPKYGSFPHSFNQYYAPSNIPSSYNQHLQQVDIKPIEHYMAIQHRYTKPIQSAKQTLHYQISEPNKIAVPNDYLIGHQDKLAEVYVASTETIKVLAETVDAEEKKSPLSERSLKASTSEDGRHVNFQSSNTKYQF